MLCSVYLTIMCVNFIHLCSSWYVYSNYDQIYDCLQHSRFDKRNEYGMYFTNTNYRKNKEINLILNVLSAIKCNSSSEKHGCIIQTASRTIQEKD